MASDGPPADETLAPSPEGDKPQDETAAPETPAPEAAPAPAAPKPAKPAKPAKAAKQKRPAPRPKVATPKFELPRIALPDIRLNWDWAAEFWRNLPGVWASLAALAAILVCVAPSLAVIGSAAFGQRPYLDALSLRLLSDSVMGTLILIGIGGGAAIVLGTLAAVLVTLCRFPGRDLFEWLLVLPLAAPVYVLAYAYSSLTWANGPIPYPLTGIAGAAFVYAIGFYPYVYLASRAAFATQSASALEAARNLGASPFRAIFRIALPLAYPGIAAGAALALMEIAADYGAAQQFGAATITTGIFRAWFAHSAPQLALQLGAILLAGAFLFFWLERASRGRKRYSTKDGGRRPVPQYELPLPLAVLAIIFCGALTALGTLIPLVWLAKDAVFARPSDLVELGAPLLNSLILAGCGAAATLALAIVVAAVERRGGPIARAASLAAGAGYAAPGAVIALGVLAFYGFGARMGWLTGLGTALALGLLIWSYAARFTATAAQPVGAGFAKVTTGIVGAARTMGAGSSRRLFEIDLPLAAPSVFAAALIVFIETLKELPATLILRPFDFDTLAVRAYAYASDERLAQAAAPALMLTIAGLIPILLLSHQMTRAWTHQR